MERSLRDWSSIMTTCLRWSRSFFKMKVHLPTFCEFTRICGSLWWRANTWNVSFVVVTWRSTKFSSSKSHFLATQFLWELNPSNALWSTIVRFLCNVQGKQLWSAFPCTSLLQCLSSPSFVKSFHMTLFEEFILMFGSWQVAATVCCLPFVLGISFGLITTWRIKMIFIGETFDIGPIKFSSTQIVIIIVVTKDEDGSCSNVLWCFVKIWNNIKVVTEFLSSSFYKSNLSRTVKV